MAGAGWHDFVPGEVLTAANVQDYLQDQTVMKFASAAARAAALPSPSQGMMSFLNDTGVVETYYAAWNATTNPGGKTAGAGWYVTDRNDGLVAIVPPTVAVSGGSATVNSLGVISFSGATSIQLNNIFNDSYSSYKIIFNTTAVSVAGGLTARLVDGTSPDSSANYGWDFIYHVGGASVSAGAATAQTSFEFGVVYPTGQTPGYSYGEIELFNPQAATYTLGRIAYVNSNGNGSGAGETRSGFVYSKTSTAYEGLYLAPSTGNFTGSVRIFGYNS